MYAYIKGVVEEIRSKFIVLDNSNIGYQIVVPNPYSFEKEEQVKVFIYHYIRENEEVLYGFKSSDEKELFLKLLEVNGIGPKSALSILASASCTEIMDAIERSDANYLKRFPGIGAKASQQIILDLKGKIKFNAENKKGTKADDLIDALVALGYSRRDSINVINSSDLSLSDEEIIKGALTLLNK